MSTYLPIPESHVPAGISKIVNDFARYPHIPTVMQGGSTELARELNARMAAG